MAEGEGPSKFEGFYTPPETGKITGLQEALAALPREIVNRDGRAEVFLGHVGDLRKDGGPPPNPSIRPSVVARFLSDTAASNNVSRGEVVKQIRLLGIEDPDKVKEVNKKYTETIGYAGDVHGDSEGELLAKLEMMLDTPPEYLIFNGDIVGNEQFTVLQRPFYNDLNNHSKPLLNEQPEITDDALLSKVVDTTPQGDITLKDGFIKLRHAELTIGGMSETEADQTVGALTPETIAAEIRRYAEYVHYGHYASNLPETIQSKLLEGLKENAQRYADIMNKFVEKGTAVHVLQGNWDARIPLDFVRGVPDAVPLEESLFDIGKYFDNTEIKFYDDIGYVDTKTSLQVILPFDSITDFPQRDEAARAEIKQRVEAARATHKTVVLVAHGEPDFRVHNLSNPKLEAKGEHRLLLDGFQEILPIVEPDEIVHGHMHLPLTDEQGQEVGLNAKYVVTTDSEGKLKLVENFQDDPDGEKRTVVSYTPLLTVAELSVNKRLEDKRIRGFGGERSPVKVVG